MTRLGRVRSIGPVGERSRERASLCRPTSWGYEQLWIRLGLGGFAVSFLAGALFFGPGWGRTRRRAVRDGLGDPGVDAAVRRLLFGSWLDVGWLVAIVFVTTVKPTRSEWKDLVAMAAIPLVFGLVAARLLRRPARPSPSVAPAQGARQ
jgi:hypothetical protein